MDLDGIFMLDRDLRSSVVCSGGEAIFGQLRELAFKRVAADREPHSNLTRSHSITSISTILENGSELKK